MSAFLSDEWLAEARAVLADLPQVEEADGLVQYVVSGAPTGRFQGYVQVTGGQVTDITGGKHDNPDCTVTLTYADALALLTGDLAPEVGFMSGQIKVEGDHRVWLLGLRPVRRSPEWAAAVERLRDTTTA